MNQTRLSEELFQVRGLSVSEMTAPRVLAGTLRHACDVHGQLWPCLHVTVNGRTGWPAGKLARSCMQRNAALALSSSCAGTRPAWQKQMRGGAMCVTCTINAASVARLEVGACMPVAQAAYQDLQEHNAFQGSAFPCCFLSLPVHSDNTSVQRWGVNVTCAQRERNVGCESKRP